MKVINVKQNPRVGDGRMYQFDDVLDASVHYFNQDELAANVWASKYALKDGDGNYLEKTPDDMHHRLAKEFARIESKFGGEGALSEEEIYEQLAYFKRIVPQGSPMMGIGNDFVNVSLSNCVVVESPKDSISNIYDAGKELANLFKRRCGVGLDISELRPDGSPVNNSAGTTTGAWSFADFYSYTCRMIGQNNRRGALMITMDVRHPDIYKFVKMKQDLSKVTGANVSVRITDEFMEAAEAGEKFLLRFPIDSDNPQFTREIDARDLWDTIVKCATLFAEPGLLMWDNILRYMPAESYRDVGFKTISTNPCCFSSSKDVFVVTNNGIKEIKDVSSNDMVWVDSEQMWARTSGYFSAGKAEVYKVQFSNGEELFITNNHKLNIAKLRRNGTKVEYVDGGLVPLSDIKVGDRILVHTNQVDNDAFGNIGSYEEGLLLGWLAGDGCLNYHSERANYPSIILDFWSQEHDAAEVVHSAVTELGYNISLQSVKENNKKKIRSEVLTRDIVNKYQINVWDFRAKNKLLPLANNGTKEFLSGLLASYFSADGTVTCNHNAKSYNLQLSSVNKVRLHQIKNLLLMFGIKSSIGLSSKGKLRDFGCRGGLCETHNLYRLTITGMDNIVRYRNSIGFITAHKQKKLDSIVENFTPTKINKSRNYTKIKSIELGGTDDVGCIEVETHHKFTANGLISGNSEIPLSAYDSCRLISINLKHFVHNRFTSNAYFDMDEFRSTVSKAQRLSDDLVELEIEKLHGIIGIADTEDEKEMWHKLLEAASNGRRTGLGTHGLADALANLCLAYDSDEALDVVDKIYSTLKITSYTESVNLAKERGAFPVWDWEKERDNEFIKSLPKSLCNLIRENGRRNIATLTNAPTGSVSLISQTASGLEPVFKNVHIRRKKRNHNEAHAPDDFVDDVGDRWQEFKVFHHNVREWIEMFDTEEIPGFFVESDSIDWMRRVEIQAVIQKHIDHAISSTINLPAGTKPEVVGDLYMEGWRRGLKGITVYVDGSRTGVLVADKKEESFEYRDATKRPQALPCNIHQASIKGEKWTILVGMMDGKPYEVFGGLSELIEIPRKYNGGKLIKNGRVKNISKYNLQFGEDGLIKDITKVFDNPTYQVHTRMISLALRHGAKPSFLVEQLLKDPDNDLTSFSKVLARVLKKYIANGTAVTSDKVCPQCESDALIYQEGCVTCQNCAYAKCG